MAKDLDAQIETAQKAVESSQARLKRLKHQRADKLLKAENEALKAKYEALTAQLAKLPRDLQEQAKWNLQDDAKTPLVPLAVVKQAIEKLLGGDNA